MKNIMELKDKLRWINFSDMLNDEYRQACSEGKEVAWAPKKIEEIQAIESRTERELAARTLLEKMEALPANIPYFEPDEYEEIVATLPEESDVEYPVGPTTVEEKLKGGWYGRMVGCTLGIPVEGWTRNKIRDYLNETGQNTIDDYISSDVSPDIAAKYQVSDYDPYTPYDRQCTCWRENLTGFPVDDDVNYTIVALKALERYGKDLTAMQVADTWLHSIPALHACTAERAAIRNLMLGILPPDSGMYCNPYREWIGAQIRADLFGYVTPGKPRAAAKLAYSDAVVSHRKNGIYGEMYIAALISMSYVDNLDILEKVRIAMSQIPPKSRLYEALLSVCEQFTNGASYDDIINQVHESYDEEIQFDWCLTIPNAMIVTACVLWHNEYEAAVKAAIVAGFDTDCNGATVGSILGVCGGSSVVDAKWYKRFPAVFHSSVHGYSNISIDEVIDRSKNLITKLYQ